MNLRLQRVADQLRLELSQLLARKVADPRVHDAAIVNVEVSRDLAHAQVRVSVLGSEKERRQVVEALEHASGFLRSQLAQRLRHLKRMPALHFHLDRGAEHSQNVSDLLETLDEHDDGP